MANIECHISLSFSGKYLYFFKAQNKMLCWKVLVTPQSITRCFVVESIGNSANTTRCFGGKGFVILQNHDKMLW